MRTLTLDEVGFVSGGDDEPIEEVVVTAKRPSQWEDISEAIDKWLQGMGYGQTHSCPAGYSHMPPDDWQERTGSPGDCAPVDITAAEAARLAATALALVGEFDKRFDKIAKWLAIFAASKAVDERQDAERDKE
jgi:hypothetical protein